MWNFSSAIELTRQQEAEIETIVKNRLAEGSDFPLSQTPTWAKMIERLGVPVHLIYSLERQAVAVLYESAPGILECTNGPVLDWRTTVSAMESLTEFAQQARKLHLKAPLHALKVSPRFFVQDIEDVLSDFPLSPSRIDQASTIWVSLDGDPASLYRSLKARLRRSIVRASKQPVRFEWRPARPENLDCFAEGMSHFGVKKNIFAPPREWYEPATLSREPYFFVARAIFVAPPEGTPAEAETQLLFACMGDTAHYLLGWELRSDAVPTPLSTSAFCHWQSMLRLQALGYLRYDLNGYVKDPPLDHPYRGVAEFKSQFGGEIVTYGSPEFTIKNE